MNQQSMDLALASRALESRGESFKPRATQASNSGGTAARNSLQRAGVSKPKNTQAPVPVNRAAPNCPSQSSAAPTDG
jgi:hypothetical protein